ncbi:MAG: PhnA domain-containing protein [Oligoflexia bacterium]|nr:PhnA domain-containing protein [Oligoflexia bacterium]
MTYDNSYKDSEGSDLNNGDNVELLEDIEITLSKNSVIIFKKDSVFKNISLSSLTQHFEVKAESSNKTKYLISPQTIDCRKVKKIKEVKN